MIGGENANVKRNVSSSHPTALGEVAQRSRGSTAAPHAASRSLSVSPATTADWLRVACCGMVKPHTFQVHAALCKVGSFCSFYGNRHAKSQSRCQKKLFGENQETIAHQLAFVWYSSAACMWNHLPAVTVKTSTTTRHSFVTLAALPLIPGPAGEGVNFGLPSRPLEALLPVPAARWRDKENCRDKIDLVFSVWPQLLLLRHVNDLPSAVAAISGKPLLRGPFGYMKREA